MEHFYNFMRGFSIVGQVLGKRTEYLDASGGFAQDKNALRGDVIKVTQCLNKNITKSYNNYHGK